MANSKEKILCTEHETTLLAKIEDLRSLLVQTAIGKEHLSDHSVVEISQELDKYIVEIQLRNMKSFKSPSRL